MNKPLRLHGALHLHLHLHSSVPMWSSGTIDLIADCQVHAITREALATPNPKRNPPYPIQPCQIHGSHFAGPRYIIETLMLVMRKCLFAIQPHILMMTSPHTTTS